MGRPTKLTPELQAKIVNAIKAGNYIETAAAFAGVSKQSIYTWMRTGARAKSGKKREFVDAVQKALAQAEMDALAIVTTAAGKHWTAAAWRLERSHPGRWGRRLEVTATDEPKPIDGAAIIASPDWKEIVATVKRVLSKYDGALEEFREEILKGLRDSKEGGSNGRK